MATFTKLPSGSWRVQVRRKGRYVSETFLRREDARRWATEAEGQADRGDMPIPSQVKQLKTFSDLINLHVEDMKEVGKAPGRSKDATLVMLKRELGALAMDELDRDRLIKFGRKRAAQGAGPVTVSMDIGAIRLEVCCRDRHRERLLFPSWMRGKFAHRLRPRPRHRPPTPVTASPTRLDEPA